MSRVTSRSCKGCGMTAKLPGPAPPGALPVGWACVSGSTYCVSCVAGAPTVDLAQRMADAATSAVSEACISDPALRAEMDRLRATHQPGSPEFVRLVRSAVETACRGGAEAIPAPIRALLHDVLACVSWLRVAERVGKAGGGTVEDPKPASPGSDPFSL